MNRLIKRNLIIGGIILLFLSIIIIPIIISLTKKKNKIPGSGPVPSPVPGPVPGPVPSPVPGPVPSPVPGPVPGPVPSPVPGPVPSPVPGPVPSPTNPCKCDTSYIGKCETTCPLGTCCVVDINDSTGFSCQPCDALKCGNTKNCLEYRNNPMNGNSLLYSCCMKECENTDKTKDKSGCCLWTGCIPCGFDANGGVNKENIYLLFLNDPVNMAKFMVASAGSTGVLDLWQKAPGTYPMFSNEVAHDWYVDPTKTGINSVKPLTQDLANNVREFGYRSETTPYAVYGTNSLKFPGSDALCGAMKWNSPNGYLCGTFDGFGIWTWENFVEFLKEFSSLTGIQELGVYDAQFLMPHWVNASPYSGSITVNGKNGGTWSLKLHLYMGGWMGLNSPENDVNNNGLWKDICTFCENQKELIKYFYMDIDSSGFKPKNSSVLSLPYLTPTQIANNAIKLLNASPDITLGAVITANPKDGFLTPFDNMAPTPLPTPLPSPFPYVEEKGGSDAIIVNWTTPTRPKKVGKNLIDPANSACIGIEYPPSSTDIKGCPNVIQNAIGLMAAANNILKNNGKKQFTRFIQDGENNGSGTVQYCVWWNSIKSILNLTETEMKNIKLGQAFSGSTNTNGIFKSIPNVSQCSSNGFSQDNLIAFPELYWYVDFMKEGIGKLINNKDSQTKNYINDMVNLLTDVNFTKSEAITFITNGAGCQGCDHDHLGPARQATLPSQLLGSDDKPGLLDSLPGQGGWLENIGYPDPLCGTGKCPSEIGCLESCPDGECQKCPQGMTQLLSPGSGKYNWNPCVKPTSENASRCHIQAKTKGCPTGTYSDSSTFGCCVSGIAPPSPPGPTPPPTPPPRPACVITNCSPGQCCEDKDCKGSWCMNDATKNPDQNGCYFCHG